MCAKDSTINSIPRTTKKWVSSSHYSLIVKIQLNLKSEILSFNAAADQLFLAL